MAITWGSYRNNSTGNGFRLGYEFTQSPSSVGTGTSSVTVTLKLYVETKASVSDSSNTWTLTGNFSGSGSVNINNGSGGGVDLITTKTRTVSTSYASTIKSSFSASLSGINAISGTASVSGSWNTAKRPISAPYAPDNITGSRNSDTSHTITWVKDPGTDAGHPYQSIEVQRWTYSTGKYVTIANLSGSATSYTDTTTKPSNQYRWRIRAKNSAGSSVYVYTEYFVTRPNPPGKPTAKKVGNDITLTWTNITGTRITGIEIWVTPDGVDQSPVFAVVSGTNPTTWTHVNPDPSKTWQYRIKTQSGDEANQGGPILYSNFSARSNTIQLLTNPLAPTQLAPSSGVYDVAANDLILTWQHNEVDGTAQTGYDLRYRYDGGAWVTVTDLSSSISQRTFPAGTLENGHQFEWQVRTYGDYAVAPAYSPWSATSTLTLSAKPVAGVISPDGTADVTGSRVTVNWSYFDEESSTQSQYRVRLYSAGGAKLLETKLGVGSATSWEMSYLLSDNTDYRIGVQVRDGNGLWSDETFQDFHVSFLLPPVPTVLPIFDEDRGAVNLQIGNPVSTVDEDEAVYNEVWRSVDFITYELIAANVPLNSTVTDYIPNLGAENVYMVVAFTDLGASASSEPVIYTPPERGGWFYLNGGQDFSQMAKVKYNPSRSLSFSRDKTLNKFAGRAYPVETAGEHMNMQIDLSALALGEDDASFQDLQAIAELAAPVCLRMPGSDRRWVSVGPVSASSTGSGENSSLSFTQIDEPVLPRMNFEPIVYRTNWMKDPSFTSLSYVQNGASTVSTIETLDAAVGTTYMHSVNNTTSSFRYSGKYAIVPDGFTMVQATIFVRGFAGSPYARVRIGTRDTPSSGTINYGSVTTGVLATTWTKITVQAVIPATTQYVNVLVYFTDAPESMNTLAGTEWGLDGVCVLLGNSVDDFPDDEYFDGDTWEGNQALQPRWTGVPNDSPSQLVRGGENA